MLERQRTLFGYRRYEMADLERLQRIPKAKSSSAEKRSGRLSLCRNG